MRVSQTHLLERGTAVFDDYRLVANAGVGVVSLLLDRLDLERRTDAVVSKGFRPGRKVATVVAAMAIGADSIDDLGVLRTGATQRVLSSKAMSPEIIGQWLRSLTWGHVRQLDKLLEQTTARAWALGAGPGDDAMTMDFDSSICQVYGSKKQGAEWAYNGEYGYHPLLATRGDTGEMLAARLRGGSANSARDAARFVTETVRRARRCGAVGPINVRADSAFYIDDVITACRKLENVTYSISVRMTDLVVESIRGIQRWHPIEIRGQRAEVGEIAMPGNHRRRLIVRRVKPAVAEAITPRLFDEWLHAGFITDREGDAIELDADHRKRAVQELAIADLKDGPLAHLPSGRFNANAAWLVLACLAHNVLRWLARLGLGHRGLIVARTMRFRLLSIPGRITRSARKTTLHLPAQWPWQRDWIRAVRHIRGLAIQPK